MNWCEDQIHHAYSAGSYGIRILISSPVLVYAVRNPHREVTMLNDISGFPHSFPL